MELICSDAKVVESVEKKMEQHGAVYSKYVFVHSPLQLQQWLTTAIYLDCPWAGPGRPSANFAGPGPRFQGLGRAGLGPGRPGPTLALTLKMKKKNSHSM